MKWVAFIFALLALAGTPSKSEMDRINSAVTKIETQSCMMMLVRTPTGEATICTQVLKP